MLDCINSITLISKYFRILQFNFIITNPFPHLLSVGASSNRHDQSIFAGRKLLFVSFHLFLADLLIRTFSKGWGVKAKPTKAVDSVQCWELKNMKNSEKYSDRKIDDMCSSSLHDSWFCEVLGFSERTILGPRWRVVWVGELQDANFSHYILASLAI